MYSERCRLTQGSFIIDRRLERINVIDVVVRYRDSLHVHLSLIELEQIILDRMRLFGRNDIFVYSGTTRTNRFSFETRNSAKTQCFDRMIVFDPQRIRKGKVIYSAEAQNRLLLSPSRFVRYNMFS